MQFALCKVELLFFSIFLGGFFYRQVPKILMKYSKHEATAHVFQIFTVHETFILPLA